MTGDVCLVTGATGNSGRLVVDSLLAAGARVRAAARSVKAVSPRPGVEAVHLDFGDPSTFQAAVSDVKSLYLVRPPAISKVETTLNLLVDRAVDAGVERFVFLSVVGAGGNSMIPHHGVEKYLSQLDRPWTFLRAGFFAQNLEDAYLRDIKEDDRLFVPAGDGKVAFVDLQDVAEVAADAMLNGTHDRTAIDLTGPQAFTFHEVATELESAVGRPIRYQPASLLGYARHLRGRGMPWMQILVQSILHANLRKGSAENVDPTLEQVLGRRPRDVLAYIRENSDIWKAS